jgi:hypothetical protein
MRKMKRVHQAVREALLKANPRLTPDQVPMTEVSTVMVLVFLTGGQCALEEDGEQVWSSDDDEDFRDEFGNEFLDADDAEEIIGYLVDEGLITEEEADELENNIEIESLEEGDEDEDEDDDGSRH